jgi:hypothetical protein
LRVIERPSLTRIVFLRNGLCSDMDHSHSAVD